MKLEIIRLEETSQGTIGVLLIGHTVQCYTLERPYLFNKRNISCVPPGSYTMQLIQSPHFGETYEVVEVPGRSHILFHAGNTISDSSGCILLGKQVGHINGQRAVLNSRVAVADFMDTLGGYDECPLYIRSIFDEH